MGRLPRAIDDGLVYHALNRGNNRAAVFGDAADRVGFLGALGKTKERYPFRLFGYCLMTNHFHEANPLRAKMVTNPAEYRWSSFACHGLGRDDPLLSPFPEWEKPGRTEAERRKRWRSKVSAAQKEASPFVSGSAWDRAD